MADVNPLFLMTDAQVTATKGKLAPSDLKARLTYQAGVVRYAKETSGIVVGGVVMPTDRNTQAQLAGAVVYVQANPSISIHWKIGDGNFVVLTAAQLIAAASAVAAHVSASFVTESSVVGQINAGAITTVAQIKNAFG